MTRSSLILAAVLTAGTVSFASGAQVLLNGATSTSSWAFRTFLDDTKAGSRAWLFRNANTAVTPIATSGVLSTVTPTAVTLAGAPDLTISGALHAALGGFAWNGDADQAARDAFSNGAGFHTGGGTMTVNIPASVALAGTTYHVELLALASFGLDRRFNVSANGTSFATNFTVIADAPSNFNKVLEFDVPANGGGITLTISPGTDAGVDTNPYLHAIAITPVPEPGSALLLGLAGTVVGTRRRRVTSPA